MQEHEPFLPESRSFPPNLASSIVHDPTNVPDQAAEDAPEPETQEPAEDKHYLVSGRSLSTLFVMANVLADYLRNELTLEEAAAMLDASGDNELAFEEANEEVHPLCTDYAEVTHGICGKDDFDPDAMIELLDSIQLRRRVEFVVQTIGEAFERAGFDVTIIEVEE